jgi:WD40 repeat protein
MTDNGADSTVDQLQKEKQEYALRTLAEHRCLAGRWNDLYKLLTNFDYLEDKCQAGLTYELINDFRMASEGCPSDDKYGPLRPGIQVYMNVIIEEAHNLVRWPALTLQQIIPLLESRQAIAHSEYGIHKNVNRQERLFYVLKNLGKKAPMQNTMPAPYASRKGTNFWMRRLNSEASSDSFKTYTCLGHQGPVNAIVFIDDNHIASAGFDGTFRHWNIDTTRQEISMQICTHPIVDLQVLLDTDICIALCERCGPISINLAENSFRRVLSPLLLEKIDSSESDHVNSRFTACRIVDSRTIVLAHGNSLWILTDTNLTGPLKADLKDFSQQWFAPHLEDNFAETISGLNFGNITSLALHSSGRLALVGYSIGGLLVWNIENAAIHSYCPFSWPIDFIISHDDIVHVGWIDADKNITMLSDGKFDPTEGITYLSPGDEVLPIAANQRGDRWIGKNLDAQPYLVLESTDPRPVTIPLQKVHGRVHCAAFGLDDSCLALGNDNGEITICILQVGVNIERLRQASETDIAWSRCRIIEQPTRIVSLSQGKGSYPNYEEYHHMYMTPIEASEPGHEWAFFDRFRDFFEISRDGSTGLCISYSKGDESFLDNLVTPFWVGYTKIVPPPPPFGSLTLLKPSAFIASRNINICKGNDFIKHAALSRDGSFSVALTHDGLVVIHDLYGSRHIEVARVRENNLNLVYGFSGSEHERIILGVAGPTVCLFDWNNRSFQTIWSNPLNVEITTLTFSPNGRQIVTGDVSGFLTSWSLSESRVSSTWKGHEGALVECRTGAQGTWLVTCGKDRLVKIWEQGQTVAMAEAPCDSIPACCDISNDGTFVVAVDLAGGLYSWKLVEGRPTLFHSVDRGAQIERK